MKNWREWLIKKLGGHVLDDEERAVLIDQVWRPKLAKAAKKRMDKDCADVFEAAFTTRFSED